MTTGSAGRGLRLDKTRRGAKRAWPAGWRCVSPRCHHEMWCAGLAWWVGLRDHHGRCQDLLRAGPGCFDDRHRHSGAAIVGCLNLIVGRRQFNRDAVRVGGWTVVVMVAGGIAFVHMQKPRLGIHAEKRRAQKNRDRTHRDDFT